MTSASTIRNIFMIATSIFMVTMSTVFFLIESDKLDIETEDLKNTVLLAPDAAEPQSEDLLDNNEDATLQFLSEDSMEQLGYSAEDMLDIAAEEVEEVIEEDPEPVEDPIDDPVTEDKDKDKGHGNEEDGVDEDNLSLEHKNTEKTKNKK